MCRNLFNQYPIDGKTSFKEFRVHLGSWHAIRPYEGRIPISFVIHSKSCSCKYYSAWSTTSGKYKYKAKHPQSWQRCVEWKVICNAPEGRSFAMILSCQNCQSVKIQPHYWARAYLPGWCQHSLALNKDFRLTIYQKAYSPENALF